MTYAEMLEGFSTEMGANWWQKKRTRLSIALGSMLNRWRVPGTVQPMIYDDDLTGTHLEVRVSPLFTVVQINGRDYYFRRLNGVFDGTGS